MAGVVKSSRAPSVPLLDVADMDAVLQAGVGERGNREPRRSTVHHRLLGEYQSPRPHLWDTWRAMNMVEEVPKLGGSAATSTASLPVALEDAGYAELGRRLADKLSQLEATGCELTHTHLDVVFMLKLVEKIWTRATDRGGGLDEEQFVDFLSSVLSMDREHLSILFQKMDANSDGTLTWDEYLSYLLREVTHNWKYQAACGTWHVKESELIPADTGSVVKQILVVPQDAASNLPGRYVLSCADHTVQMWDSDFLIRMADLPLSEIQVLKRSKPASSAFKLPSTAPAATTFHAFSAKPSTAVGSPRSLSARRPTASTTAQSWLGLRERPMSANEQPFSGQHVRENTHPHSAIAYYGAQKQIAVAGLDRTISFFGYNHSRYTLIDTFSCVDTPLSIACETHTATHKDMIIIGDAAGKCSVYGGHDKSHLITINPHGRESVRRVALIPGLGLVSAGLDSRLSITDTEKWKTRHLCGHKRGIYSFAYSSDYRCMLSAGFDGKVLVWDPYFHKPIASLNAQHSSILDVLINSQQNQIFTACADKKIRVFDIRTYRCIQSIVDTVQHHPHDVLTSLAFDKDNERLVSAGSKLRVWPVQIAPGNKSRRGGPAHSNLVTSICYSKVFKQVVSVSVDESVRLWDIFTGKSVFTFSTTHNSPITAAVLDDRGKRFITAANDGSVKMWNFNNGACMHEYRKMPREITQILFLPRSHNSLAGLRVDGKVARWPDPGAPKNADVLLQELNDNEILSMCADTQYIITGCMDAEIVIWYLESGFVTRRIKLPKRVPTESTASRGDSHGVTRVALIRVRDQQYLLAGTDDGSVHFLNARTWSVLFTLWDAFDDSIAGFATNAAATRLMVIDSRHTARLYDIQNLTVDSPDVLLVRQWQPHGSACITDVICVDDIEAFVTAADNGEISLWSFLGQDVASFGQTKQWPFDGLHETQPSSITAAKFDPDKQVVNSEGEGGAQTVASKQTVRYAEAHPAYVPKTLKKSGLRTAGFSLNPRSRQPITGVKEEKEPIAKSLLAKLNHLEEVLKRQDEARDGAKPRLGKTSKRFSFLRTNTRGSTFVEAKRRLSIASPRTTRTPSHSMLQSPMGAPATPAATLSDHSSTGSPCLSKRVSTVSFPPNEPSLSFPESSFPATPHRLISDIASETDYDASTDIQESDDQRASSSSSLASITDAV